MPTGLAYANKIRDLSKLYAMGKPPAPYKKRKRKKQKQHKQPKQVLRKPLRTATIVGKITTDVTLNALAAHLAVHETVAVKKTKLTGIGMTYMQYVVNQHWLSFRTN